MGIEARAWIRDQLARHDAQVDIDDVLLVATELVVNAVVHGVAPVQLALSGLDPVGVEVEVADHGTGSAVPRTPDGGGGRGLRFVEAIADRWGVRDSPASKSVWAQLGTA